MNKHEAEATARQMEAAGFTVTGYRRKGRGEWFVEALDNANGETVTIYSAGQWGLMAGWMNATAPQPGARLKRPELGATVQHSVTLPESCWQDIEALGVNPKGKNVRSEGVFKLWQAWKGTP